MIFPEILGNPAKMELFLPRKGFGFDCMQGNEQLGKNSSAVVPLAFTSRFDDFLGNPWESVGNGMFVPRTSVCGRARVGK